MARAEGVLLGTGDVGPANSRFRAEARRNRPAAPRLCACGGGASAAPLRCGDGVDARAGLEDLTENAACRPVDERDALAGLDRGAAVPPDLLRTL